MGRQVAGCQLWLNSFLMPGTAVGSTDKVAAPGQLPPSQRAGAHTGRLDQPRQAAAAHRPRGILALAGEGGERLELTTSQGHR